MIKQAQRDKKLERLRMIAGTPADREALRRNTEEAERLRDERSTSIGDQIVDLSRRLRAMERDANLSRKRLDEAESAARELEQLECTG